MITQTEVDGVPTLLAPNPNGPLIAGLTFRVGQADETLARAGITHLLEHLALHQFGLTDYHYNGSTGAVVTHFHTQGSPEKVTAFVNGVCAALGNLPMDRLDMEKGILRTERGSRVPGYGEPLAVWRHGAIGYGLPGHPEFGLRSVGPDDLRAWAARYFTRDNAVLWIAGDAVPAGLRLDLPGGTRQPVPPAWSALPETPAYFCGGASRIVAFDAVVRRSVAAGIYTAVLERELFRALRQEDGLSYMATATYSPRGDDHAMVTAAADALPDKHGAVLGGFVDVLAKLRVGRIEQADLDTVCAATEETYSRADFDAARLPGAALNHLTGQSNLSTDEMRAELKAVTLADVHAVAVEAAGTALLMVPGSRGAEWAGFAAAPTHSTSAVTGRRAASRTAGDETGLVIGPYGVTLDQPDAPVTVEYANCAALLVWPDGGRQLIGADALFVPVEPTMYGVTAADVAAIDNIVPADRHVPMPARDPESIPVPPAEQAVVPKGLRLPRWYEALGLLFFGILALPLLLLIVVQGILIVTGDADDPDSWLFMGVLLGLTAGVAWPIVALLRRLRRPLRR
ncbi:M16 family metallopeptidase [Polymorphospora lycopeni]|uniref:Insulinase family protein n=1 Tax=Polymorphospora lycopeni TaxID=3140240 RepID=A0ABV5CLT4_9ACTN